MIVNEGEWKKGIWHPKSNNPNGFNKHNKNNKPKKVQKKKTKQELIEELGKTYHKQWQLKREVLTLGHKIAKLHSEIGEK